MVSEAWVHLLLAEGSRVICKFMFGVHIEQWCHDIHEFPQNNNDDDDDDDDKYDIDNYDKNDNNSNNEKHYR